VPYYDEEEDEEAANREQQSVSPTTAVSGTEYTEEQPERTEFTEQQSVFQHRGFAQRAAGKEDDWRQPEAAPGPHAWTVPNVLTYSPKQSHAVQAHLSRPTGAAHEDDLEDVEEVQLEDTRAPGLHHRPHNIQQRVPSPVTVSGWTQVCVRV
jgi:hypothetical protein